MMTTATALTRADIECLPNFKKKTAREYSAACPFCGTGDDRFLYWPDNGNYWCRVCEASGFVEDTNRLIMTEAQREAAQRAQAERQRKLQEQQQSAVDKVATMQTRVKWYHDQVSYALAYWYSQGLTDHTIDRYLLGYAPECPTFPKSPSYVIPYFLQDKLVSIRHRLANPDGSGKYRPEFAGLPVQLFNADALRGDEIPFDEGEAVLVEGEVKAMVLYQHGFRAVGVPGVNSWKDEWLPLFKDISRVFIAFDPGKEVERQAFKIGRQLARAGLDIRVAAMPAKPDDMFVRYGCQVGDFMRILSQGRVIR